MAGFVQCAEIQEEQVRLVFLDVVGGNAGIVFHGHNHVVGGGVGFQEAVPVHGQGVGDGADAVPVVQAAGDGVGALLPQDGEDGGRDAVAVIGRGRDGAVRGVPFVESVHFGGQAVHHGGPVDARCRRHHGTLGKRPAALLHEGVDVGQVFGRCLTHGFGSPAIDADKYHVLCFGRRSRLLRAGYEGNEQEERQNSFHNG